MYNNLKAELECLKPKCIVCVHCKAERERTYRCHGRMFEKECVAINRSSVEKLVL